METPEQYTVKTPEEFELVYDWAKCGIHYNHGHNEEKLEQHLNTLDGVKKGIAAWQKMLLRAADDYGKLAGCFEENGELKAEIERLKGCGHSAGLKNAELIKENERLRGTIGVECVKQLLAAREENKLYREALTEAKETLNWHLSNSCPINSYHQSDFFNLTANAFTIAESALSKFQPKKDERTNG